jgi:hypothetical protein
LNSLDHHFVSLWLPRAGYKIRTGAEGSGLLSPIAMGMTWTNWRVARMEIGGLQTQMRTALSAPTVALGTWVGSVPERGEADVLVTLASRAS